MPIYKYKAAKQNGEVIEDEMKAATREELVASLQDKEMMVITVEEKVGLDLRKLGEFQIGDIPLKEKVFFVKQMAAMLKAGLPIVQSLEILLDQTKNSNIKTKLTEVYKDIKAGLPMAQSFRKQQLIFNELQLNLIQAGEQSGNLVEIMKQIAVDMQKAHQLRSKIRGALIYPAIILITALIVIIVLVVFMIPAVEALYLDFGATREDIPWVTRSLVVISDFFTNPLGLTITFVSILSGLIAFRAFYKSDFGRRVVDRNLLRLPIFGSLISKTQVLQMTRLLGMLIRSGIPIIDALKSTGASLGNIYFRLAMEYTADKVSKGSPISPPLARTEVIPMLVVKMIATGEDTGSLDGILADLTQFYEDEVEEITSNLTKLMEPIMLLIVGGLVAFLALAVYLPIYSLAEFV